MTEVRNTNSYPDSILLVALALSLVCNVGQVVRGKWSAPGKVSYSARLPRKALLPVPGASLEALHLIPTNQQEGNLTFRPTDLPIVVYVLSPTCGWCKINVPMVNSLATQLRGKYRLVGLSGTSKDLAAYVQHTPVPFPVYSVDPKFSNEVVTVDVTPRTLVFSPTGKYLQGWDGAYNGQTGVEIARFFGVNLTSSK